MATDTSTPAAAATPPPAPDSAAPASGAIPAAGAAVDAFAGLTPAQIAAIRAHMDAEFDDLLKGHTLVPTASVTAVATASAAAGPPSGPSVVGHLHNVLNDVQTGVTDIQGRAKTAIDAGDTETHAALSRLETLFGEFRNGLVNFGKALPANLEAEAAKLAAMVKL